MKSHPLWQALGAYLAGGWLLLQIVDSLGHTASCHPGGHRAALGALLVGLHALNA